MTTTADRQAQAAEVLARWNAMKAQARTPTTPSALEAKIGAMDRILNGCAQIMADMDGTSLTTMSGGDGCGKDFAF